MSAPMFSYTVFIPRVFSNIKEDRITESFDYLEIGSVDRVDLVRKTGKNGETYNMAFVHFAMVYDTEAAANFRSDLEGPEKKTKVTYDGHWFWLVLPFEQKERPTNEPTPTPNPTPTPTPTPNPTPTQASVPVQPTQQPVLPPPNNHMMNHMVPVWVMTQYGPELQWGCPQDMGPNIVQQQQYQQHQYQQQQYQQQQYQQYQQYQQQHAVTKLVPRQVAYGNRYNTQRNQPRKRLNAPSPKSREETYARSNVTIDDESDTSNNEKEDGEC